MKICGVCRGVGFTDGDICEHCEGEGIVTSFTSFVSGKQTRRKSLKGEIEDKKIKFDKKNATREMG